MFISLKQTEAGLLIRHNKINSIKIVEIHFKITKMFQAINIWKAGQACPLSPLIRTHWEHLLCKPGVSLGMQLPSTSLLDFPASRTLGINFGCFSFVCGVFLQRLELCACECAECGLCMYITKDISSFVWGGASGSKSCREGEGIQIALQSKWPCSLYA